MRQVEVLGGMRTIFAFILAGAFIVIAAVAFRSVNSGSFSFGSESGDRGEIYRTVEEFWDSSLLDVDSSIRAKVTVVPANYYENLNRCLRENGEIARRLSKAEEGLIEIARGVFDEKRSYEFADVLRFASKIKDERLATRRIVDFRRTDSEASVTIEYGNSEIHGFMVSFLLTRLENEWRIFMIGPPRYVSENNPYFARPGCSLP